VINFISIQGRKTIQVRDFKTIIENEEKYEFLEGSLFGKTGCIPK